MQHGGQVSILLCGCGVYMELFLKLKLMAVVYGGMRCHIAAHEGGATTMLEAIKPDVLCQICISQATGGSPLVSPAKPHHTVALHVALLVSHPQAVPYLLQGLKL